jgi:cysteine desulfurase
MVPFLAGSFGNPSSLHEDGRAARKAVEVARGQVASRVGATPEEIIFTASGTEADNLALIGAVRASGKPGHLVTSSIEHAAISETCRYLARSGTKITQLPVNGDGLVRASDLLRALQSNLTIVSVMAANNVVGTLQPIEELAYLTKLHGVLFHTDAVQAGGRMLLDTNLLRVDLLSLSAHKLHGPKGIGALYVRKGTRLAPLIFGGGQERGLRSATENVAGIVGFGAAAEIAQNELREEGTRLTELRDLLWNQVRRALPQAYLFGASGQSFAWTSEHWFQWSGEASGSLLVTLDSAGVAVSAGSACSAHHSGEPSGVALAMGYDAERARGLIRISLGRFNTREEVNRFVSILIREVNALSLAEKQSKIRQPEVVECTTA